MSMPETCDTKNTIDQSDRQPVSRSFLSRRRFVSTAAATLLAASAVNLLTPTLAFATTSAEKQAEADEVKRKMDEWEILLEQYASDYYDALDAYDLAVENMNAAQLRIDEAVAREDELTRQLDERARTMYKQGPLSFLDVIFGSHSFVEFTTSWDLLNTLNNRDVELIRECQEARAEAEAAHEEYERQEQIAIQKLAEAEEIRNEAQAIYDAYQAELERLNEEVRQLIEEERRAEEERQRRLEEERQRQAQAQAQASSGGGTAGPSGYVPYDGSTFSSIVDAAMSRLGCPYVWAATGPNSFDCSGLTSWCYRQVGISIPRGGNAQYLDAPMKLAVSDAQPGDILYKPGHVGLCIGGGQFIHAPRPGYYVCIMNISGYGWVGAARWR
jgi:cell wall-associated NlpC family hydrolase